MEDVLLAALNTFQAVALAVIGYRQAQVKKDLNGALERFIPRDP